MKLFYDNKRSQWYHSNAKAAVTFGGDKQIIPFHTIIEEKKPLNILLNVRNEHAGPLIGILTARKTDGTITGNSSLFIKLQKKLLLHGGFSYIFTPESVKDDGIIGYTFLPGNNGWKKIKFPYPDLVYNRIPFRKEEESGQCKLIFSVLKKKEIPFFNPCFLDKYELYSLFQQHSFLKSCMPPTALACDKQKLSSFLEEHQRVYLKPSRSAKGKGIFRLTMDSVKQLFLEGLKEEETYPSFQHFWEVWEKELTRENYLVQEEIKSEQYEGKKFDFRILAHADNNGYAVTGVGVRQSQPQNLTTHIPNGGRILPYTLFQTEEHDQFIKMAVTEIGHTLSRNLGYFGEFSIDAGIGTNGNYYIYEVNSKPMSFDEKEIEEKKITQLCRLFFQMTKFPFMNEN